MTARITGVSKFGSCFGYCSKLQEIYITDVPSVPVLTGNGFLYACPNFYSTSSSASGKIYVPSSLYSSWIVATWWSSYYSN